jgi:predicted membrane protein
MDNVHVYIAIASLSFNALLSIAMYYMKLAHDNTKENMKRIEQEVKEVRDTAFKKEDFKDFRDELWKRLDKFEEKVEARLSK